jgi:DNA polymerase/3'-5' exonuclease PolX
VPELSNPQIAAAMEELGDLYELDGVDHFRVNSYRNAARSRRATSRPRSSCARRSRSAW